MKKIIHSVCLVSLFLTAEYDAVAANDKVTQPNIIFVLSDDQAWNGLSARMHPDLPWSASDFVRTPNIAQLAK